MLSKKLEHALNRIPRILSESETRYTTKDVDAIYTAPKELPNGVMSILVNKVTVIWYLDVDEREWGIKGFVPEIHAITGLKEFESMDPDKKNWEEDASWNIKDYTITFEADRRNGSGFVPTEVVIDEPNRTIQVTFGVGLL
jgi:hypothetical protein